MKITKDSDGGITIDDRDQSGVMLSVISRENGVLYVEPYPYHSTKDVLVFETLKGRWGKPYYALSTAPKDPS